jgi:hypothetical protein
MTAKEGLPSLQWPTLPRHHLFRDCRLGDVEAELQKLAVDVRRTPERVLETHSSDKVAHLFVDPRPATAKAGLPPPERTEAVARPTHDRLGPDNCYCVKDAREAAIKPDEQRAIGPSHVQPTWRTPLKHVQLMLQHQDLGFQPPP